MYSISNPQLRLIEELEDNGGILTPRNGQATFDFYAWCGAFSPIAPGLPDLCATEGPPCVESPPFCVDYPFVVNEVNNQLVPQIIDTCEGESFVPDNSILTLWQTFDPYFALCDFTPEQLEKLKRQTVYFDSGADLELEPIDNVSSRYFSDKLTEFDMNHEYFLYDGGHTSCLDDLSCYRYETTYKLFSGAFAAAGEFIPDIITTIVGNQLIELTGSAVMTIEDKAIVGVETDDTTNTTNLTIRLLDQSRFSIGTETTLGGGLQVGNRFGKANLLFDPSRNDDSINFTLEVNGPEALFQIGKQGFLGATAMYSNLKRCHLQHGLIR